MQDVRASRIVLLVCQGEAAEPVIQRRLPAIERRNVVNLRQFFYGGERLVGVNGATLLNDDEDFTTEGAENTKNVFARLRTLPSSCEIESFLLFFTPCLLCSP